MKKNLLFSTLFIIAVSAFIGCKKDEVQKPESNIIPETFKIDIPESISNSTTVKSAKGDILTGNELYEHLRNFIHIGESAADIVDDIIGAIRQYNINKAMETSFTGDDDGRTKNLVVVENATDDNGTSWEFIMTISDEDGGIALQVFWSRSPIRGYAILNPYNIDRKNQSEAVKDAMYKIEYEEQSSYADYDSHMIVSIANLPLADRSTDRYSVDNLKMFVGKKGEIIDVYGNSNHPNAYLVDPTYTDGFSWSFTARADRSNNIGVASVGLPPCNLTSTADIFTNYSIHDVLFNELIKIYPDTAGIESYLVNTEGPGYFSNEGFVSAGTAPDNGSDYSAIDNLSNLSPYAPNDIKELSISFFNN